MLENEIWYSPWLFWGEWLVCNTVKYWNGVGRKNGTEEQKNRRAENGTEERRRERSDEVTGESGGILKGRKMLGGRRTVKENNQRTEDGRTEDGRTESRRTENQWTRIQKNGRTEGRKDVASTYVLRPRRRTESLIY